MQYSFFRTVEKSEKPGLPSYSGWQYLGMCAAFLGLSDDAYEILLNNCKLKNLVACFPAMWGPAYDSVPDTDHGANILNLLQSMLMQTDGQKIYLLPAWKKNIDVSFIMYADKDTKIEAVYKKGKFKTLNVTPKTRMKDIIINIPT